MRIGHALRRDLIARLTHLTRRLTKVVIVRIGGLHLIQWSIGHLTRGFGRIGQFLAKAFARLRRIVGSPQSLGCLRRCLLRFAHGILRTFQCLLGHALHFSPQFGVVLNLFAQCIAQCLWILLGQLLHSGSGGIATIELFTNAQRLLLCPQRLP